MDFDEDYISPIQRDFDDWAETYDDDIVVSSQWVAPQTVSHAVAKHAPRDAKTIIDLGTGTGLLIPLLGKGFAQAAITAVDFSRNMITRAEKKGLVADFIQADLSKQEWNLGRGLFDIVTASGLVEFIQILTDLCSMLRL